MRFFNGDWSWDDIQPATYYAAPKYNGLFVTRGRDFIMTREGKEIPNPWVRAWLEKHLPRSCEAEFLVEKCHFNETMSIVSNTKLEVPSCTYRLRIFDCRRGLLDVYSDRIKAAAYGLEAMGIAQDEHVRVVTLQRVQSEADMHLAFSWFLKQGYDKDLAIEGLVLRNPKARYKRGRTTVSERNTFKWIDRGITEGRIVGFTDNKHKHDHVGAFIIETPEFGKIKVGTGFTSDTSMQAKAAPEDFINLQAVVGYKKDAAKYTAGQSVLLYIKPALTHAQDQDNPQA